MHRCEIPLRWVRYFFQVFSRWMDQFVGSDPLHLLLCFLIKVSGTTKLRFSERFPSSMLRKSEDFELALLEGRCGANSRTAKRAGGLSAARERLSLARDTYTQFLAAPKPPYRSHRWCVGLGEEGEQSIFRGGRRHSKARAERGGALWMCREPGRSGQRGHSQARTYIPAALFSEPGQRDTQEPALLSPREWFESRPPSQGALLSEGEGSLFLALSPSGPQDQDPLPKGCTMYADVGG